MPIFITVLGRKIYWPQFGKSFLSQNSDSAKDIFLTKYVIINLSINFCFCAFEDDSC